MYQRYRELKKQGDVWLKAEVIGRTVDDQFVDEDIEEETEKDIIFFSKNYHPDTRKYISTSQQPITREYLQGVEARLSNELGDVQALLKDFEKASV